jgi:predicted permease
VEAEMSEEFRHHLSLRAEDLVRSGLSPQAAARQARIEFGHVETHRESAMASRGLRFFDELRFSWLDVKLGARMLVRYPALTIVSGLAMAFAIAVGAATFQLINQNLHPTLPLPDGERVVGLNYWDMAASDHQRPSLDDFLTWRMELTTVEDIGAFRSLAPELAVDEGPGEPVELAQVSAVAFRVAGVPPLLGRALVEADEEVGAPPVVVLGHRLWKARFGGDSAVVGRVVRLGDARPTVVGVMPERFSFPVEDHIWMPLRIGELRRVGGQGSSQIRMFVFGRLAPGASLQKAQAELTTLTARAAANFPERYQHLTPQVRQYVESIRGNPPGGLLQASIYAINLLPGVFLILMSGTVAMLMFARAISREREILVRTALGASRVRIVTQFLAEALVLGALAAGLGLYMASHGLRWGLGALYGTSENWAFWIDPRLSSTTVIYAVALTLLAAVITGAVPGLKITARGLDARLRQTSAGGGGLRLGGIWTGVIIAQIAATMLFIFVAYPVHRYASQMAGEEVGFVAEEYLSARLEIAAGGERGDTTAAARALLQRRYAASIRELVRRLRADPGVSDVTVADMLPLMNLPLRGVELDDGGAMELPPGQRWHRTVSAVVDPDFFEAFQTPVLFGRAFDSQDLGDGVNTVVVNQSFVDRVLGGRSAIGRRVRVAYAKGEEPGPWYEIVGVVRNLVADRYGSLDLDELYRATVYHPLNPSLPRTYPLHLAVHMRGDPAMLGAMLHRVAGEVSPMLRLRDIQRLDQVAAKDAHFWKVGRDLVLAVSAVALFLSLAAIYAVMSFTVARRTREIGIRVALGAQAPRIMAEIFRRPIGHVATGVAVGCVPVGMFMILLAKGVTISGVILLLGYAIAMMGVCALACIWPTLRALRVEPTVALSADG